MKHILLVVILAIVLFGFLYVRSTEGFENPSVDKTFFNNINNLFNPVLPRPISHNQMTQATQAIRTSNQPLLADSYDQGTGNYPEGRVQMGEIYTSSEALKRAQTICEIEKTANCSAFDKPEFAQYCGISLDIGTKSTGEKHTGGLYIDPDVKSNIPSNGAYFPTFGSSEQFAINKETCQFMKDDYDCKHGGEIGTRNCTQCFTDSSPHAIAPNQNKENTSFGFYTNATDLTLKINDTNTTYTLLSSSAKISTGVNATAITYNGNTYVQVTLGNIPFTEKNTFLLTASSITPGDTIVIAGYIQAQTQTGLYTIDMNALVDTDNGQTPNIGGNIKGYLQINQLYGTNAIQLTGKMPFTFLSTTSPDAYSCSTGPFITSKEGADFIATNNPCYGPDAQPGKYGLPCLQKLFLGAGGTTSGSGYPKNDGTALTLLVAPDGTNRTLSDIADYLYQQSVLASTGLVNGNSVDMQDWNAASQYMTGKTISNPCETSRPGARLSNDCLTYLYQQSGCLPLGTNNPDPNKQNPIPQQIQTAQQAGDKTGALNYYSAAYLLANDNSKHNDVRAPAFLGCYGVTLEQQ